VAPLRAPAALQLPIRVQSDVARGRRDARAVAAGLGFSREDVEAIGLAVSELATNLVRYASEGRIGVRPLRTADTIGVEVDSRDHGPGIADLDLALQDGFSTGGGLGAGLPAVRRLMDDFELTSGPTGTTIICRKWQRPA
jgi:serine/threonine-protein kinase RsbT